MSIQRLEVGPRMSRVVIHADTVYLAGVVGKDGSGSMAEQTRSCLDQIDARLASAGTDKSKLLTTTIWITDIAEFDEMNAVWDAWIDPENPPARACVQTVALARPNLKVEMMRTAAL